MSGYPGDVVREVWGDELAENSTGRGINMHAFDFLIESLSFWRDDKFL